MFEDKAIVATLSIRVDAATVENTFGFSAVARRVAHVRSGPYYYFEGFWPECSSGVRPAGSRYLALLYNLIFLREILHEGRLIASRIFSPSITCFRQYLHLNYRRAGDS
jgi:hypothetical protein